MLASIEIIVVVFVVPRSVPTISTTAFFLAATQLVGMVMSRRDERYRRRDFHQARLLAVERAKSERLLANMLPEAIANRLKQDESVIAEAHEDVTVLFADIVGFTVLSGAVPPAELVDLLNRVFTAFDELADRFSLEKIKTVGDAYLVVGGLPKPRADHTASTVEMAFAMLETLATIRPELRLSLRIGVHVGPVVAGVIGKRKYSYDLWSDTVNTASRMESHGAPGRIDVSETPRLPRGQSVLQASMDEFFKWLGPRKSHRNRLAVMDMWKPFRNSTLKADHAPQASILFDRFHVLRHLGDAMDQVRKSECARLTGKDRRFIKGQKYTLLSHLGPLPSPDGPHHFPLRGRKEPLRPRRRPAQPNRQAQGPLAVPERQAQHPGAAAAAPSPEPAG